jgi:hypothetical protein
VINFLTETLEVLKENSKTPEDVRWVGTQNGDYALTWDEFKPLADFEYDNEHGAIEIASDLIIVGDDWWLNRWIDRAVFDDVGGEFQEEWAFHKYDPVPWFPAKRDDAKPFKAVRRWERPKVERDARRGIGWLNEENDA